VGRAGDRARTRVTGLYPQWASTGEFVFYIDDEQLPIGDTMICSIATVY
jgi:hypothetical protein